MSENPTLRPYLVGEYHHLGRTENGIEDFMGEWSFEESNSLLRWRGGDETQEMPAIVGLSSPPWSPGHHQLSRGALINNAREKRDDAVKALHGPKVST